MGPCIHLIAAVDSAGGIGWRGGLPWALRREWGHFLALVTRKPSPDGFVCWVMGRASWELHSRPGGLFEKMDKEGHKVLRIVMSRSLTGTLDSLSHAAANWGEVEHVAARLASLHPVACCWNLGGAGVYRAQLESRSLQHTRLYLTLIEHQYECDAFFPNLKVFGLNCVPSDYCVKNKTAFKLTDVTDEDVDTTNSEHEDGVTWRYRVLQFTAE